MFAAAFGREQPVASNDDASGRAKKPAWRSHRCRVRPAARPPPMAAEAQALRAQLERLRDQGQATADGWRLDLAALLARLEAHARPGSRQLLAHRRSARDGGHATCWRRMRQRQTARPQRSPAAALAALTASLGHCGSNAPPPSGPAASLQAPATHADAPAVATAAIDQ